MYKEAYKRPSIMLETYLDRLMSRKKIPVYAGKKPIILKPEEIICIEFADELRRLTISNRLNCCWMHVTNEGKRGWLTAMISRAMGLIPGCPDYVFLWNGGCGVIEFKTLKGVISPSQKDYKEWCDAQGIAHAYCRSVEHGLDMLVRWRVLA